jgi:hypothetical protein
MAHPQQQFADIVQQTQSAFTKGAQSWAGGVQRFTDVLPQYAPQVPNLSQWVDGTYGYFEQALGNQRRITETVAQAVTPALTSVARSLADGTVQAAEGFASGSAKFAEDVAKQAKSAATAREAKGAASTPGAKADSGRNHS